MSDSREVFEDYLRGHQLKMTPQRRLILEVFLSTPGHLTSEELFQRARAADKSVGQATVYRTLKLLTESGLAKEVNFGDGVTRYEKLYGREHHDHIICKSCGRTVEVVDERIEELQEELAEKHGFELTGHKMYLYGLCGKCKKKG
jgi:Fur family ferric uptake transcriptional regulator